MNRFHLKSRDFISTPERKREFNERLFSAIAPEYAGMSRVLSLGRDPAWKRRMIADLPARPKPKCLDIACGNGDLSALLMAKYCGASVTALDLSEPMLRRARRRFDGRRRMRFLKKDMMDTGLPDSEFDIIAAGYALRNAPDLESAAAEIARLLKPGGILAMLDFSRPDTRCFAGMELKLLRIWCGTWGLIRSGNPDTYGYIAESLADFPFRTELHCMLNDQGFEITGTRRHFFGIIEAITAAKMG